MTLPRFAGAVLTGGASRRMGTDKALVEVDGMAMAGRVAGALASAGGQPVIAVGGDADRLADLGLAVAPDRWPGEGPLGGIVTALGALADPEVPIVVAAACDLPALTSSLVAALVAALAEAPSTVGATLPVVGGVAQPHLLAVRATAAAALLAAFQHGERAPRRALHGVAAASVDLGEAAALRDVDRPEDLPTR